MPTRMKAPSVFIVLPITRVCSKLRSNGKSSTLREEEDRASAPDDEDDGEG